MVAIIGIVFIIVSGASFWRLLPTNGKIHRLATAPFLESIIPICIVAGFAIGVALVFAGITVG
jgi:hypothetical protein